MAKIDPSRTATLHRFRGHGGLYRLAEALADQFVVYGDRIIANRIAKRAAVQAFSVGSTLMEQGDEETSIAFLLAGTVEIVVNGHPIAVRHAGNHVGEMALLDPLSRRSATVRATEMTIVAIVSEYDFSKIAQQHPHLWRRLALSLGERLRERSKFHRPPNKQPAVFIGSSREGLTLAECLYGALRRSPTVPRLWSKGVFECSKTVIEDLTRAANESDFAILVLTGDDMTTSRRARTASPRDNVIFELGLFMGTLGRDRTYVLAPSSLDIKVPTDLLGVTFLTYASRPRTPSKQLREPIRVIRAQIKKHGPRRAMGTA